VTTAFWDAEEVIVVDIIPRVQTSYMPIQTLKTYQKRFRGFGLHTSVAEIPFQHDNP